jgi:hypothetical protein
MYLTIKLTTKTNIIIKKKMIKYELLAYVNLNL